MIFIYLAAVAKMTSFISLIPTTLLLMLSGIILLFVTKGKDLPDEIQASTALIVELAPDIQETEISLVLSYLNDLEVVAAKSIQYVKREDALSIMFDQFPELSDWDMDNPFTDIISFQLNPGAYSEEMCLALQSELTGMEGVRSFFFNRDLTADIARSLASIKTGLITVAILLLGVILFLLQNAYRMELALEKNMIRLMDLVGATPAFIRKPYLLKALKSSVVSIFFAISFAIVLSLVLNMSVLSTYQLGIFQVLIACLGIVIFGLIVGVVSTYIILNLYLRDIYKSE